MADKTISLSSWTGDSRYSSIDDMLEAAKAFHEGEKAKSTEGNRAICIFLDDRNGSYRVAWQAAQLKPSGIVTLMQWIKTYATLRLLGML